MRLKTPLTRVLTETQPFPTIRCPAQILVIDRMGGPASVLMNTVSLLLGGEMSLTEVDQRFDVLRALDCFCFDLVVIGVEDDRMLDLTVLPEVKRLRPEVPALVVGKRISSFFQQYARHYGAAEVLDVPHRAAELRDLVRQVIGRYVFVDSQNACGD